MILLFVRAVRGSVLVGEIAQGIEVGGGAVGVGSEEFTGMSVCMAGDGEVEVRRK